MIWIGSGVLIVLEAHFALAVKVNLIGFFLILCERLGFIGVAIGLLGLESGRFADDS